MIYDLQSTCIANLNYMCVNFICSCVATCEDEVMPPKKKPKQGILCLCTVRAFSHVTTIIHCEHA